MGKETPGDTSFLASNYDIQPLEVHIASVSVGTVDMNTEQNLQQPSRLWYDAVTVWVGRETSVAQSWRWWYG